jgi:photosystem II stability/assembly factor-like uncharacterized protein
MFLSSTPVFGQEGRFEDDFENPELPGWQHTPNAYVSDGFLRIEPGGFASPEGAWGSAKITMRMRYTGQGEIAFIHNMSEAGASILLYDGSRFQLQREEAGKVRNVADPVEYRITKASWTDLSLWIGPGELVVFVGSEAVLALPQPAELTQSGFAIEAIGDLVLELDHFIVIPEGNLPMEEPSPEEEPKPEGAQQDKPPSASSLEWVRLGGPPGGLGYDIRYNFDDHNTWYVTDANAGVHISKDDGLTWQQSNTGIDSVGGASGDAIPIFCLTVDPHNPQIIWAGTDMSGRIYKSVDGGASWESKDQGIIHEHEILLSFRGFTVDPRSSDIVYAMGELQKLGNNVWGLGVGGVIYKTTNGGDSWVRIWHGKIPSSLTRYMWIHPEDPNTLYVSTGIFDRGAVGEGDPETDVDPFGGLGVLKSTDGGQSWETLGKENGLELLYIGSLFMHPENPDVLLAAAGHVVNEPAGMAWEAQGYSPAGIYRTSDGGETWTHVLEPEESVWQAFSAVDMCPSDPNIVYAGSDAAVFRSEDAGLTWEKTAGGLGGWGPPGVRAGWPIDMQCDPEDTNRVFANNYSGGNFLSEDGGRTWTSASSGYSGAQIIQVEVDPFNPARVFAGGRSGGWYSEDGGLTWQGIRNPGDTQAQAGGEVAGVAIDPTEPNHILIGAGDWILEWRNDEGVWQPSGYLVEYGPETSVIEFAPSDPNIVYAGSANHNTMVHAESYETGRGVLISRDGGTSWEIITGAAFTTAMVTDLAVHPTNAGQVYVATRDGLFVTEDYGGSWAEVSGLPKNQSVRSVGIDPKDPNIMLAGVYLQGLYRSTDGGASWNKISAGLEPNGNHRDILFDPKHPGVVYTSDISSGVYRSEDGGQTWLKLIEGLTNRAATGLSLSADGNHLYAGTSGGGVFRLDLNGQPPVSTGITLFEDVDVEPSPEELETEAEPQQVEPVQEAEDQEPEASEEEAGGFSLPCLGSTLPLLIFSAALIFTRRDWKKRVR